MFLKSCIPVIRIKNMKNTNNQNTKFQKRFQSPSFPFSASDKRCLIYELNDSNGPHYWCCDESQANVIQHDLILKSYRDVAEKLKNEIVTVCGIVTEIEET